MVPFLIGGIVAGINERQDVLNDDELKVWMLIAFAFYYFIVCAAMKSSKWKGTSGKQLMKL